MSENNKPPKRRPWVGVGVFAVAISPMVAGLYASGFLNSAPAQTPRGKMRTVRREDYGQKWPFTVDYGTFKCINGVPIFAASNGSVYSEVPGPGRKDIREITIETEEGETIRESFESLTLTLCE